MAKRRCLEAMEGHYLMLKLLLVRDDVQAGSKDNDGRTLLSWVASRDQQAVVKLLLEQFNVEVNLKDNKCRTPWSWAFSKRSFSHCQATTVWHDIKDAIGEQLGCRTPLPRAW
jgi:ankyrin repeat protein